MGRKLRKFEYGLAFLRFMWRGLPGLTSLQKVQGGTRGGVFQMLVQMVQGLQGLQGGLQGLAVLSIFLSPSVKRRSGSKADSAKKRVHVRYLWQGHNF